MACRTHFASRVRRVHARQRRATNGYCGGAGTIVPGSHDDSGVTAWRGFRTRYRRRASQSSDGQACHADHVGVPLTRASRGPHNHKVADRCTSIARSLHKRKHEYPVPTPPVPPGTPSVTHALRVTVRGMPAASQLKDDLARLAWEFSATANPTPLREQLEALVATAMPDALIAAAEPYRDEPEIIAPIYEAVVAAQPDNARAMVVLANAYWLQGRGPQVVGELATRAMSVDPSNRGAWHLWALSESNPRDRVRRWQQVSARFPEDHLALAAVADNAASVAGAEHDYAMLDVAIDTYERLLLRTREPAQRDAVSTAISALRGWRF